MGIIRLSLLTVGAMGVAMLHFGKNEGLPDDRIGREPTIVQDTIQMVSAGGDVSAENEATQGEMIATANAEAAPAIEAPAPVRLAALPVAVDSAAVPQTQAEQAEAAARAMATSAPQITLAAVDVETTGDATVIYVSGSRVNMRAGPSTGHGVVSSLTRGTAVLDMGDAGNGWSQIKVVDTGVRGFMSSKFLSPSL